MKKLLYFFGLLWSCAYLLPLSATAGTHKYDTVTCNIVPKFEWVRDSANCKKIRFINQTTPATNTAHFIWNFGDGTSSNDFAPSHIYANEGLYNVCLVVETNDGCRKEVCKTVEVRCQTPPPPACNVQSKFEWQRDSAQWNKIWLRNLSQPIQNIWKTSWSYGDGTSSQDFNSFHVYQQPGVYNVCLKVTSLSGCVSTFCQEVRVGTPCDSVRVKFEYRRDSLKPYKISFFAVSNVPLVHQRWVITRLTPAQNMTATLTQNNPVFSFSDSGWYQVCLHAITANNCKKSYCERIYIERGANGRLMVTESNIPVYPNPARNTVRVEVQVETATVLQMRVLDATGNAKMEFKMPVYSGNNHVAIPVEKLSSGFYVVEIRYGNQLKLAKFQKS